MASVALDPSYRLAVDDIQGIILRGYSAMRAAAFVLLEVTDRAGAQKWLAELDVTSAVVDPRGVTTCVNVAFTAAGLGALGVASEIIEGLSREMQDGMVTRHRTRLLGDTEGSSPDNWWWGRAAGPTEGAHVPDPRVHVMLLLYAQSDAELGRLLDTHRARLQRGGLAEVQLLTTELLAQRKEHFGFRDGIAQPQLRGFRDDRARDPDNTLHAGEVLLGYPNEYGKLPAAPDFANNGSYLVVRTLRQDVGAFWRFVAESAEKLRVEPAWLASRMVGRWPSGAPIVKYPDQDPGAHAGDDDDFTYAARGDEKGHACPIGAHIRRTNPRDDMADVDAAEATKLTNRHRIVRRGRAFGRPHDAALDPRSLSRTNDDDGVDRLEDRRGLHFLCFCADISRQFEFIQNTWMNNPKGLGLYDDPDPMAGPGGGSFTMQGTPARRRVTGVPRFVHTRGGAYFFMPGLAALRVMSGPHCSKQ